MFALYDAWIGFFWDGAKRRLYFFPIPFFGFCIQLAPKKSAIVEIGPDRAAGTIEFPPSDADARMAAVSMRGLGMLSDEGPAEACVYRCAHFHVLDNGRRFFCEGPKDKDPGHRTGELER